MQLKDPYTLQEPGWEWVPTLNEVVLAVLLSCLAVVVGMLVWFEVTTAGVIP